MFATSEARVGGLHILGGSSASVSQLTAGALGVQMQATIFDFVWILVIQNQAFMLIPKVFLSTEPSFQPLIRIFKMLTRKNLLPNIQIG